MGAGRHMLFPLKAYIYEKFLNGSDDFYFEKEACMYKNGLGNAHPALCSTYLQTSYSIISDVERSWRLCDIVRV
jgi:hypothetical protein